MRPDIVLWVVTRIPEMAAKVEAFPNVYIHFSLDRDSLARMGQFEREKPASGNYFFSYQCARGEVPAGKYLRGVAVLFFDNNQPTCNLDSLPSDVVCPLNAASSIVGVCETCRRCFNGAAVAHRRDWVARESIATGPRQDKSLV